MKTSGDGKINVFGTRLCGDRRLDDGGKNKSTGEDDVLRRRFGMRGRESFCPSIT